MRRLNPVVVRITPTLLWVQCTPGRDIGPRCCRPDDSAHNISSPAQHPDERSILSHTTTANNSVQPSRPGIPTRRVSKGQPGLPAESQPAASARDQEKTILAHSHAHVVMKDTANIKTPDAEIASSESLRRSADDDIPPRVQ